MPDETTPREPATASAAPKPRARTPYWDNARAVAIVLVVIGHAIQPLNATFDLSYSTYLAIYAFHMPAFALLAGYFSRATPTPQQVGRVFTDLLAPYLILELIWTTVRLVVEGRASYDVTTPSWTLWFLLALAIFRLLLPLIARLRWPLVITILVSVGTGYFSGVDETFSLARALGLLPFFTLGWWLKDRDVIGRLQWLERDRFSPAVLIARGVAAALLIGTLVITILGSDLFREFRTGRQLYYATPYEDLDQPTWAAGLVRLLIIGIGVLLTVALLVLVPRSEQPFTELGQHTLYVYLLHTVPLYVLRQIGVLDEGSAALWFIGLVIGSFALTALLASKPVRFLARPVVEPRVGWMLARDR